MLGVSATYPCRECRADSTATREIHQKYRKRVVLVELVVFAGLVELVVAQGPREIDCFLTLAGRSGAGTLIVFEVVAFTLLQQSNLVFFEVHFPRTAVALLFLMMESASVALTLLVLHFRFDSGPEQRHTKTLLELLPVLFLSQAPRFTLSLFTMLGNDGADTLIVEQVRAVELVLVLFSLRHRQHSNLVLSTQAPMAATLVLTICLAFFLVSVRSLQVSAVSGPRH
jgi:hypothetical protein